MSPRKRATTLALIAGSLLAFPQMMATAVSPTSAAPTVPAVSPTALPTPLATLPPCPSPAPTDPTRSPDPTSPGAPSYSEPVGVASPMPSPSPSPITAASADPIGMASPTVAPTPSVEASEAPCLLPPATVGLGVGPSQILLGQDQTGGTFTLFNAGSLVESIRLVPSVVVADADGNLVAASDIAPTVETTWLDVTQDTIELAPGESRAITFSLVRPVGAAPGDHVSRIKVLATVADDVWAEYIRHRPGPAPIGIRSNLAFDVTVITRVPGEIIPRVVVPPFEAFLPNLVLSSDGQLAFSPTIHNEGNVAAVWMPVAGKTSSLADMIPTLKLIATGGVLATNANLFDGTVSESGSVSLSPLVVLPGATHTQHLTMTDAPLFGTYDYIYTLPGSAADGRETITQTGHFTIVNLQKVLLWVVLPLLVLMTLAALAMIRRHHTTTKRRMAEALRQRELQQARQEAYELARREQQHQARGPW